MDLYRRSSQFLESELQREVRETLLEEDLKGDLVLVRSAVDHTWKTAFVIWAEVTFPLRFYTDRARFTEDYVRELLRTLCRMHLVEAIETS